MKLRLSQQRGKVTGSNKNSVWADLINKLIHKLGP